MRAVFPLVLVLQRQLEVIAALWMVTSIEDLLPDASGAPALIAAVDRFPGTKLVGEFPPGAARPDDPKDAREDQAVVGIRPPGLGFLRWEQGRNARPALIRQLEPVRSEPLDGGRPERWCLLPGSASGVALLGHCLVPSAKGRPAQAEAAAFGWLGDGEEQSPHLGHGQGKKVCRPPFSPAVACRRVTSR